MGLRWAITAKVILTVVTLQLVNAANGYKLNVDTSPEKEMKNMTCESYCGHCGCAGTFFAQENKCVCACDNHAEPDCIAEIQEKKDTFGLDYTFMVRSSLPGQPPVQKAHIRVARQSRPRARTRPTRTRRTRRPRRNRARNSTTTATTTTTTEATTTTTAEATTTT
ncbi:T-cell immunoglobulin and mucin domain-containing protein 2-like isoform X2 [Toxorhynchites rutilus septentrionalis]|uniref:T-cell immunoglobulin and mucin domain-containing protein 2-like isoform X2 n=1 Tax=Toxorhynchites rutilus septentrionalis TaxID=329112 RepID=UPI0024794A56|nr:T-cell immunoglobulin and mucin domain-containing protein 2-like isoform X2 [Toxorhynchites rutilus septentrionalis]